MGGRSGGNNGDLSELLGSGRLGNMSQAKAKLDSYRKPSVWEEPLRLMDERKTDQIVQGFKEQKWPWMFQHPSVNEDASDNTDVMITRCFLVLVAKKKQLNLFQQLLPHIPADVSLIHRGIPLTHYLASAPSKVAFLVAWLKFCSQNCPSRMELERVDHNYPSALASAAIKKNLLGVRALLKYGSNPNSSGNDAGTPLIICAQRGMTAAIESILSVPGANINGTDKEGRTALHWAAARNKRETVAVLLQAGIDHRLPDNDGSTALERAYKNNSKKAAKIISKWNEVLADINRNNLSLEDYLPPVRSMDI